MAGMLMKVTYLNHSGFLVELEARMLLFDFIGGPLPELAADKKLLVFVSHRHQDHFSKNIFQLADSHPNIGFILSDDIWQNQIPEKHNCRTLFIDPGQTRRLDADPGTRISTFHSTDEGVAFLVETEGTVIYHAGDLNDWVWKGEDKAWNDSMSANYAKELADIAATGLCPDVAFLPLDGRLEEWFYLGLHKFMETVGAGRVFPMHFWDDYSIIGRLKALPCTESYRDRIMDIKRQGQEF